MLYLKFFGILRQYYPPIKKVDFKGQNLKDLLRDVLDEDFFANENLRVLLNGKYVYDKDVLLKENDTVAVYIFGGKGYPGG